MPRVVMEHLSDMQQGLVMAIRSLMADAAEDQVSGELLRAQFADMYPPIVLLSPDMMTQPLIHQTLLAWLRTHDVHLGGTEDMRSVKRLAATLYPAGGDKRAAQRILNNIDLRNESLCRCEDAPPEPGFRSPSQSDRLQSPAEAGLMGITGGPANECRGIDGHFSCAPHIPPLQQRQLQNFRGMLASASMIT